MASLSVRYPTRNRMIAACSRGGGKGTRSIPAGTCAGRAPSSECQRSASDGISARCQDSNPVRCPQSRHGRPWRQRRAMETSPFYSSPPRSPACVRTRWAGAICPPHSKRLPRASENRDRGGGILWDVYPWHRRAHPLGELPACRQWCDTARPCANGGQATNLRGGTFSTGSLRVTARHSALPVTL